jgi:hypothetical protein
MRTTISLLALAPMLLAMPTAAQDILDPLQDMVEEFTQSVETPRPAPRATPEPDSPTPPPVPRPRPPSLPDEPVVEPPETPEGADEAEDEPEDAAAEGAGDDAGPDDAADAVDDPAELDIEPEVVVEVEPARVYQVACPAVLQGLVEAELAPPLDEGICQAQSPLVVTAVRSGGRMVSLSSPVTTNCQMASALPGWLEDVDGYAQAVLDSPVAQVSTGPGYVCRSRRGGEEVFTSEHGFANAVDVSGFTLEDGRSIGVLDDWMPATAPEGRLLRLAHDAACASFTTVLGPEANAEHEDHLHFDLGCHGASCTARICE